MIKYQIGLFLFSFLLTYLLVPLNIKFSNKYSLIDHPKDRGVHNKTIPLAGGLSFAFVIVLCELLLIFLFKSFEKKLIYLAVSGMVIVIFGLYDDSKNSSPYLKLLVQIFVITLLYYAGFRITEITNPFGDVDFNMGYLSMPITFIWFLVIMNAINLIDGLDGLAAGIIFSTTVILIIIGNLNNFVIISMISSSIAGATLAFLKYNFYPAKIFMGDTGSLFLGLNIAAISIFKYAEFKRFTAMTLLIPISILILPISDMIIAVVRRVKNRQNIMLADKEHIHHQLLKMGLSQKNIALISYIITLVFGLIAVGFSFVPKDIHIVILLVLFALIFLGYFIISKENKK